MERLYKRIISTLFAVLIVLNIVGTVVAQPMDRPPQFRDGEMRGPRIPIILIVPIIVVFVIGIILFILWKRKRFKKEKEIIDHE